MRGMEKNGILFRGIKSMRSVPECLILQSFPVIKGKREGNGRKRGDRYTVWDAALSGPEEPLCGLYGITGPPVV